MKREIKFRVWDPLEKEMDYNDVFIRASGNPVIYQGIERPDVIIMQYTEMKDRDSKEIYEGDIVNVFDTERGLSDEDNYVGTQEIKWENGYYCDEDLGGEGRPPLNEWYFSLEKIGNIYQNPELLTSPAPSDEGITE